MGYSLPRKLIVKGFISFLLSLMVVIYPALCFSQSQDTTSHRGMNSQIKDESPIRTSQDRPDDRILENSESFDTADDNSISENASLNKQQRIAPVISFATQSLSVSEGDGSIAIGVELIEANNISVEVAVVYLSGPSSASASDISGFKRHTLRFDETDPPGTIKEISILIADDSEYEDGETAVFRLQDITAGTIVGPAQLDVTIHDNDTPDIIINEVYADVGEGFGDANGDGLANSIQDQFVEIVNNAGNSVDLSGWRLSDALETRYVFPAGTILPAGRAAVIFGGGSPSGYFGGAEVFIADGLELDNTGESIELSDEKGNPVAEFAFSASGSDGESITRNTDISGTRTVKHSEASNSGRAFFSPGTRIDGTSFGSRFAVNIRGNEGWRLISTPAKNTTFADLFGSYQMQPVPGSNSQHEGGTIYEWDAKEGTFKVIEDLSNEMKAGKGYAIYLFEDNDPNLAGVQGGFPKMIATNEPENNNSVPVTISSVDSDNSNNISDGEGWNLLGNPFGVKISVDGVLASLRNALKVEDRDYDVNGNIYVWDPAANGGNGDYIVLEENSNKTIAPFQAFWIRTTNITHSSDLTVNALLERNKVLATAGNRLYKESNSQEFGFELYLGNGNIYDDYQLVFNNQGGIELDRYDAFKLSPLSFGAISLYSSLGENDLMKNVLPSDLATNIEIPLHFEAGDRQSLSFSWQGLGSIPDNWQLTLFDRKLNKEINLRSVSDYSFTIPVEEDKNRLPNETQEPQLRKTINEGEQPRFVLTVSPGVSEQANSTDIPESVKLNPNYPNPFNPTTTISFELKEESEVLLSIWNIVGQRVVTLVDGMREAGEHTATWNASEMPSGIYIAQLEVGGEVFIRKMTLIK